MGGVGRRNRSPSRDGLRPRVPAGPARNPGPALRAVCHGSARPAQAARGCDRRLARCLAVRTGGRLAPGQRPVSCGRRRRVRVRAWRGRSGPCRGARGDGRHDRGSGLRSGRQLPARARGSQGGDVAHGSASLGAPAGNRAEAGVLSCSQPDHRGPRLRRRGRGGLPPLGLAHHGAPGQRLRTGRLCRAGQRLLGHVFRCPRAAARRGDPVPGSGGRPVRAFPLRRQAPAGARGAASANLRRRRGRCSRRCRAKRPSRPKTSWPRPICRRRRCSPRSSS